MHMYVTPGRHAHYSLSARYRFRFFLTACVTSLMRGIRCLDGRTKSVWCSTNGNFHVQCFRVADRCKNERFVGIFAICVRATVVEKAVEAVNDRHLENAFRFEQSK